MAKKAPAKKKTGSRKTQAVKSIAPEVEAGPSASAVETVLSEVVGQDRAVGVLSRAMEADRVHHGWIFTGPAGVGKRTTALAFARELLVPAAGDAQRDVLDGQLRRGHHPDLHVVSASLASISREAKIRTGKQITLAREVVAEFVVEPAVRTRAVTADSMASKVFVIVDAHLMGAEAQNLLLKTLEEPPAGTVIVLVTESEDRLLATIRSRCQRVVFTPLGKAAMEPFVERACAGLDDRQRFIARVLSEGSPGRLSEVIEGGLVRWADELDQLFRAADAGKPVPELGPQMSKLVSEEAERRVAGQKLASKDAANRRAAADMLRLVAERHRRLLRQSAESSHAMRCVAAIEAVQETESLIRSNVPMQHAFNLLAAELAWAGSER